MTQSSSTSEHGRDRRGIPLRAVEFVLWTLAAACLLPVLASWALRSYVSTVAIEEVAAAESPAAQAPGSGDAAPGMNYSHALRDDRSLWSSQRVDAFERMKSAIVPPVAAALELPRQDARIPVFSGVDETTMTLGAGHLPETAPLDGDGNIALTAHRDGTFRVLKDVEVGDPLILEIAGGKRTFTVTSREVVAPDRVDVLDPTPTTTLTLITCHPFYFVGSAPDRFILQAELEESPDTLASQNSPHRASSRGSPGHSPHSTRRTIP